MLDLRTIRDQKFDGDFSVHGGTVNVSWSSEVMINPETFLLEDEFVEEFIWEFLHEDLNVIETNHYACEQLDYKLEYEYILDVPDLQKDFKSRMSHLMTCITWDTCPLCGEVAFTFINPDHLDTIWDKQTFSCCTDGQQEAARALRKAHADGRIHEDYLEQKLEEISILIEDGEVATLLTEISDFVVDTYDKHLN